MSAERRRYRVVVVGVARDRDLSPKELSQALLARIPLPPDVRLAVESGRSAVIQTAESEQQARRAATLLIKLGAEIRIEPEDGPGGGVLSDVDFGDLELSYLDDTSPSLDLKELGAGPPKSPPTYELPPLELDLEDRGDPTQVDVAPRPPAPPRPPDPPRPSAPPDAEPQPIVDVKPRPDRSPVSHTPIPRPSSVLELPDDPPPIVATPEPAAEAPAEPPAEPPAEETGRPASRSGTNLIRCPLHGLLYDANVSSGCSRCEGAAPREEPRGLTRLRTRPRLWIALGVFLSLALSSIPAVLYAGNQKRGPLLQQRIEAEAIRRGRIRSTRPRHDYNQALRQVATLKSTGLAVTAVIWLVGAAVLMFLWFRFI